MAVGAEFIACLDVPPRGYIPFTDFFVTTQGPQGLVD
jgi:hypothetical protein